LLKYYTVKLVKVRRTGTVQVLFFILNFVVFGHKVQAEQLKFQMKEFT